MLTYAAKSSSKFRWTITGVTSTTLVQITGSSIQTGVAEAKVLYKKKQTFGMNFIEMLVFQYTNYIIWCIFTQ